MSGEVEKCPILHVRPKFDVFTLFKTCAVSMSNTGKQQFSANLSIYQLSDKDCSVLNDIDFRMLKDGGKYSKS